MRHIDTVVIGGGQAGLAMSYCLTQRGFEHIVLERNRLVESWRSKRWDSLTLVAPNWTLDLPGFAYDGLDPDGFMSKDEVVAFLERYAASFDAPLQTGTAVRAVANDPAGNGYILETDRTTFRAKSVVIATGEYQLPKVPLSSANLSPRVAQVAAFDYRHPDALPTGAVLVVGSGESGCQIAQELRDAGRAVYLSTGTTGWIPREYRAKDGVYWAIEVGVFDQTVDTQPPGRPKYVGPQSTGRDGGHDLNLHTLARDGVVLLGRLEGIDAETVTFASDLHENIGASDEFALGFCTAVDEYIEANGLDAPVEEIPRYSDAYERSSADPILELDLVATGIAVVTWATGYRPDFGWVRVPVLDDLGYPIHDRGVTRWPGLYFLGLDWLYKMKSGTFLGIGEDAEYLATAIAQRSLSTTTNM